MTDFEYKDDLFGEDNSTLAPTMQLIHTQNEGIINAVKNSANIRFLAKVANMLKPADIKKERERFTEDNLSADNDSGMIIYDNKFSDLKQKANRIRQTHCRCSTYRKMYARILVQIWIFCKINLMKIRGMLTTRGK